jgi:hypothetical protein
MKVSILITAFLLFMCNAFAQPTGSITGNISGNIQGASVSLLRAKDSATVKLAVSDKTGGFSFEKIADGKYLVSVTAAGHRKSLSKIFELAPLQQVIRVPEITLNPLSKELAAVSVTAKRPLVEQRIDRTVVNVEASIGNLGTSALEVLEKAPGVSVDRDGNISLKGKEGVLVMIDGRPTQLGGADLANMLRNMSSNQLDQVEIMTNPPARYDASGTSGIINIKTKKNITAGFNGSASVAYGQGKYAKTNEGFVFNYREGKVNLFSNLSHNYQKRYSILNIDRNIYNSSNAIDNIFNQQANRVSAGNSWSAKLGADLFATKKTTVGAVVNLNSRGMTSGNPNVTNIFNAAKDLQSVTSAMVNNENDWNSFGSNLNFRSVLNKRGREITADVDFAKHSMTNELWMVNSYTDAAGTAYRKADTLTGLLPQEIEVYGARVDYVHPLKKDVKFEAGIKAGLVRTDNNAEYDSIENGQVIHDFIRSNHFVYEENINAAYANFSSTLSKKISAQFGLRAENTNAQGTQLTTGATFNRHYTQLFPTAYFQYKANEKNNFGANFGRRVSRPSYQSLNPFIKFIDRYTFSQGNPSLKPSISNSIELSHTWKKEITTTVNYTKVKNIIHEVIQQKGQEAYNMPANVASLNQFGIAVNANTEITKWWTSNISANLYNDHYETVISGTPVNQSATSFILAGTQQLKITRTLTGEINGRFRNGWLEGIMRVKPIGFMGAGLSKQVWKNQGTLRLTARDIFHTQRMRGRTQYGNVDLAMRQVSETRVVTIGFSYRFSKGKKVAPVKRTLGSANEEQERIGQ